MGDNIYLLIIWIFFILYVIIYGAISGDIMFSKGDYGYKYKAKKICSFLFVLCFNILSFVLSFFNLEYNFTKIVATIIGIVSLLMCFYDMFIDRIKSEKYIMALQKHAMEKIQINDIFTEYESKAKYDETGNDSSTQYRIVESEYGKAIISKTNKQKLLVPKNEMSKAELEFICHQMNVYWTENYWNEAGSEPNGVKIFMDKSLYNYKNEYVEKLSPRIEFLLTKKFKKFFSIILVSIIIAIILLWTTMVVCDYYFDNHFLTLLEKWLFG